MPRGSSALAAVETEIVERPLRGDVPSTGYLYCIYNSMQGDLDKNTRHVRGLDRSRHTESEETPMESTRQSDEPARSDLLGGADEPIGASPLPAV